MVQDRKFSRRQFLRWTTALSASALAAACAPAMPGAPAPAEEKAKPEGPAQVTITWWNPDVLEWQPAYNQMADAFMQRNPSIKVEVKNVPEEGYDEKINTMIAGGTGPDVWVHYYATSIARHGFLQSLSPYIERDGLEPEKLWFPICVVRGQYNGQQYSVPRDGVWSLIAYNQDLFDEFGVAYPEEGWTLDDYLNAAKAITNEEKGTWGTLIAGPGALEWDTAFCWNMGFELVSEDGRQVQGLLDSQTSIEAIQWILDLQVEHKVAPMGAQVEALGDFPFGSGKAGMAAGSGWELVFLREAQFRWGLVPAPVKERGAEGFAWGDSVQYYMWSGSQQKDAAWELMKFVSSPEGSKIAAEASTWTPPAPEAWLTLGWDKDPIMGAYWAEAQKPTRVPNYLRTEYQWDCVQPPYEDIWTRYIEAGERPLDAIVRDAAAQAQKCLDERYAAS